MDDGLGAFLGQRQVRRYLPEQRRCAVAVRQDVPRPPAARHLEAGTRFQPFWPLLQELSRRSILIAKPVARRHDSQIGLVRQVRGVPGAAGG